MLPPEIRELVRHMEWADALVWRSVLSLPSAHSDANLRERLYHVHVVQRAYLHIWRDDPIDVPEMSSFEDLRAIRAWAQEYYDPALEYLDGLDAETLERPVNFPWAERLVQRYGEDVNSATLAESILQVSYHTTYHRGQINTRLRELGSEPPLTDFIAWIWMGKPAAQWEEPSNEGDR